MLVLAAWTGWGTLLDRLFRAKNGVRADWGLRACWGMALSIAVGGVLNCVQLARTPMVAAFILLGALIQGGYAYGGSKAPAPPQGNPGKRWLWLGIIGLAPALQCWAAVAWPHGINVNDDFLAYMVFPQRMLQTGTFLDPFNLRRLAAFGGHSFLQAQTLVLGTEGTFHLLDMGLCPVLLVGLVVGYFRPVRTLEYVTVLLVSLSVLFIPVPRINTMCSMSGVVLLLALFRSIKLQGEENSDRDSVVAVALVAAAVCTLRANFWPAAVGSLALSAAGSLLASPRHWRHHLARAGKALGLTVVFLLPWSMLMFLSSRSFLYPLMRGYQNPKYELFSHGLPITKAIVLLFAFCASNTTIAILVLPGLLGLWWVRGHWRESLPFCLACLITAMVTICQINLTPFRELWRFTYPLIIPAFIVGVLTLLADRSRSRVSPFAGFLLLGTVLLLNWNSGLDRYRAYIGRLGVPRPLAFKEENRRLYARMQAALPPGKRVLTVLDFPTLLDFRRNDVFPVDVLGSCSPPPGMPFFQGAEALAGYFRSISMDYVAVEDFQSALSLYNRKVWIGHRQGDDGPVYQFESDFFLDFMMNMDALCRSRQTVFQEGPIRVIRP
jgi:hypothetical protein